VALTPDPANANNRLIYFIQTDHLNAPQTVMDRQFNTRTLELVVEFAAWWRWRQRQSGRRRSFRIQPEVSGTIFGCRDRVVLQLEPVL
jgi:hypothetical protein